MHSFGRTFKPLMAGIAVLVLTGAAASTAAAEQRFAAPGGSGEACTSGSPCSIQYAVEASSGSNPVNTGDDVTLTPGTYNVGSTGIVVLAAIDLHGQAGSARPVIVGTGPDPAVSLQSSGAVVRDLNIDWSGTSTSGIVSSTGLSMSSGIADRISAHASAAQGFACGFLPSESSGFPILRDSVCVADGDTGAGLGSTGEIGGLFGLALNDDVIGTGPTSFGIFLDNGSNSSEAEIQANGTVADGTLNDLEALSNFAGVTNASAGIGTSHSAYNSAFSSAVGTGNSAFADSPGTNGGVNAALVQLVACAPGCGSALDLHPATGSPLIDAGQGIPAFNGAFDFDGNARIVGPAIDIGAYEVQPPSTGTTQPNPTPNPPPPPVKKCKKHRILKHGKCVKRKKKRH